MDVSVTTGAPITQADMDALATLANATLASPYRRPVPYTSGDVAFDFSLGTGWKAELERLRVNLGRKYLFGFLQPPKTGPYTVKYSSGSPPYLAISRWTDGLLKNYVSEIKFISPDSTLGVTTASEIYHPTTVLCFQDGSDIVIPGVSDPPHGPSENRSNYLFKLRVASNSDINTITGQIRIFHNGTYTPTVIGDATLTLTYDTTVGQYDYYDITGTCGKNATFEFGYSIVAGTATQYDVFVNSFTAVSDAFAATPSFALHDAAVFEYNLQGGSQIFDMFRMIYDVDLADFIEDHDTNVAEVTAYVDNGTDDAEGVFLCKTFPLQGGGFDPIADNTGINDERITRFSTLTHRALQPWAELPTPYPPARFLVGYQQDGSGETFYNGSRDHYQGNADYNYGFGEDPTAPHSPTHGSYYRIPGYPVRKSSGGVFDPFTRAQGLFPSDFEVILGGMIYSVTARRSPVKRGGFNVPGDSTEAIEIAVGNIIAGEFIPIGLIAIAVGEMSTTIYPSWPILNQQPLYYSGAATVSAVFHSPVTPPTAVPSDGTAGALVWPIMAAHYNDTEALLLDI